MQRLQCTIQFFPSFIEESSVLLFAFAAESFLRNSNISSLIDQDSFVNSGYITSRLKMLNNISFTSTITGTCFLFLIVTGFCDAVVEFDAVLKLVYVWPETTGGEMAMTECFPGSNNSAVRQCLVGGGFEDSNTTDCIDCGSLEPPLNGFLDLNDTSFQSVAIYSCETGYNLIGELRTCTINATWSGEDPVCQSK